jgi:thiamine pyrophosphate-dependent acetolactate synthase large subunit-like protein
MKRWEALAKIAPHFQDALVVVCNGMLGRDLFGLGDRPNRFYMIGSMGLASSIGLGLALAQPKKRVVVLDGDGNVLMNLGGLANVGAAAPKNLYHVILDNGTHASTGDQKTISRQVRLEEIAKAAGYRRVWRAADAPEFWTSEGPVCLLIEVEPGNQKKVPRVDVAPHDLAARFRTEAMR